MLLLLLLPLMSQLKVPRMLPLLILQYINESLLTHTRAIAGVAEGYTETLPLLCFQDDTVWMAMS